jgi:phenylalanine-4-hydroxylase
MFQQEYEQYTPQDHEVWRILYNRQIAAVHRHAYAHFATGLKQLHFGPGQIPDFREINRHLEPLTGWQVDAVPGLIPGREFFQLMQSKHFVASTWIRKMEQLDYLEEPDMFHDTFGHIPLLADPVICDYLSALAKIAEPYLDNEAVIEAIGRLYWFTVEFGLVKEDGDLRIYGAGILSSVAETTYCLSDKATRFPFDLEKVLATPYPLDHFQEQYFVIDSMDHLLEIPSKLEQWLITHYPVSETVER